MRFVFFMVMLVLCLVECQCTAVVEGDSSLQSVQRAASATADTTAPQSKPQDALDKPDNGADDDDEDDDVSDREDGGHSQRELNRLPVGTTGTTTTTANKQTSHVPDTTTDTSTVSVPQARDSSNTLPGAQNPTTTDQCAPGSQSEKENGVKEITTTTKAVSSNEKTDLATPFTATSTVPLTTTTANAPTTTLQKKSTIPKSVDKKDSSSISSFFFASAALVTLGVIALIPVEYGHKWGY